jgi:hypothetical protein
MVEGISAEEEQWDLLQYLFMPRQDTLKKAGDNYRLIYPMFRQTLLRVPFLVTLVERHLNHRYLPVCHLVLDVFPPLLQPIPMPLFLLFLPPLPLIFPFH